MKFVYNDFKHVWIRMWMNGNKHNVTKQQVACAIAISSRG